MTDRLWICERRLHVSTLEREWCADCTERLVAMTPWVPEIEAGLFQPTEDKA